MKKVWLLLLSLFTIFWFWVSFANPIAPETHYICSMFENVKIDNYRVVVQNGSEFYEPKVKQCSECGESRKRNHDNNPWWFGYEFSFSGPTQEVFLLDKSINLEDLTTVNVYIKAIPIWSITSTYCDRSYNKTKVYKIIKSWNSYTMLDRTERYKTIQEIKDRIKEIPVFWLFAVTIETLILFFIAKFFWRKYGIIDEIWWENNEISNKKLLLFWIIPTTITLPLLWFVLPLIIWNEVLYVIIWELLVVLIESIIIKYWLKVSWIKAVTTSFICNLFSFIFVLPTNNIYIYDRFLESEVMIIILYVLSRVIVLFVVVRLLRKNTELSNKRISLVWILGPLLSLIVGLLLIFITTHFNLWDWLVFIAIWIYLVLELVILEYWLKASRKKALIAFILSILWFVAIYFLLYLSFWCFNSIIYIY